MELVFIDKIRLLVAIHVALWQPLPHFVCRWLSLHTCVSFCLCLNATPRLHNLVITPLTHRGIYPRRFSSRPDYRQADSVPSVKSHTHVPVSLVQEHLFLQAFIFIRPVKHYNLAYNLHVRNCPPLIGWLLAEALIKASECFV